MSESNTPARDNAIWAGDERGLARRLEQRYGVQPLAFHREYPDDELGEIVYDALTYEPGQNALLLAVDLEMHSNSETGAIGVATESLPPEEEVRDRVADVGPEYQCPNCDTYFVAWDACGVCDFHSLEWWSEQLGEEPTVEHRINHALRAVDRATSGLSVLRDRVPQLEVTDDWDEDGIRNVNQLLEELESSVSDINGEVSSAYLALRDIQSTDGSQQESPDNRRVDCPDVDDHYARIAKAMNPGLLITVNDSGGANAPGRGTFRVVRNPDGAKVLLEGSNGSAYRLNYTLEGDVTLTEVDDSGDDIRPTDVETIEVIGIGE